MKRKTKDEAQNKKHEGSGGSIPNKNEVKHNGLKTDAMEVRVCRIDAKHNGPKMDAIRGVSVGEIDTSQGHPES